jgi:SAM-dependent MidA family methyltransferase
MKMPTTAIREEIEKKGYITFHRFMEIALYCPDFGYYETNRDIVGRSGDFYTSVSTGNLFGQMLAFQFAAWLDQIPNQKNLRLIEAGAHDGRLARDIMEALQATHPGVFELVSYVILEPSPRRREWQQETLKAFGSKISWKRDFAELNAGAKTPSQSGIIFSNELLDAFPIHRFIWNAKDRRWAELGVTVDGEGFKWITISGSDPGIPPSPLDAVLPDNYIIESSPAAMAWWREAAASLESGKLLTIDYGMTDDEVFNPARLNGTLRAYFQHHVTDDVLARPGEQDLTAHINFSAIQKAGEATGLTTDAYLTQPQFLTRILSAVAPTPIMRTWGAPQTRQFQTLTHPEHLGRSFKVLIQSRQC